MKYVSRHATNKLIIIARTATNSDGLFVGSVIFRECVKDNHCGTYTYLNVYINGLYDLLRRYASSRATRKLCDIKVEIRDENNNQACEFSILTESEEDSIEEKEFYDLIKDMMPMACPKKGSFVAWKCVFVKKRMDDNYAISPCFNYIMNPARPYVCNKVAILKLRIPMDAKRSSAFGIKCRASKVEVLEGYVIDDADFSIKTWRELKEVDKDSVMTSMYVGSFGYEIGKTLCPQDDSYDDNRFYECSYGIHFFMDIHDAVSYAFCYAKESLDEYFAKLWYQHNVYMHSELTESDEKAWDELDLNSWYDSYAIKRMFDWFSDKILEKDKEKN